MERVVFMERLFSKRREKLVDMCVDLYKSGMDFLYILPSSSALHDVRRRFFMANKGFLWDRAIVFDDLEMRIVKDRISIDDIIYSPADRVMIAGICRRNKDKLKYYTKLYDRTGLHEEISKFIRTLKRSCISEEKLMEMQHSSSDDVLRDKLHDLYIVYESYNDMLRSKALWDRNDISAEAAELSSDYKGFEKIHSIIIDGFTDIEIVSMRLVQRIAQSQKVNIYVNCPYRNRFMEGFLNEQIRKPFYHMGFEIAEDEGEHVNNEKDIKELCEKLYSGDRMENKPENVSINKYPCIEAEVRGAADDIKKKLMEGDKPENIAVYINNRGEYSRYLADIFREYDIPINMNYELPLSSSERVRKVIKSVEQNGEDSLRLYSWFQILHDALEDEKTYMQSIKDKVIDAPISMEDMLEIKAFDALNSYADGMKSSFEKSGIINDHSGKGFFMGLLYELLKEGRITIKQGSGRGVKIQDTALAKGVYYTHVYILGLNEDEIPKPPEGVGLLDRFEIKFIGQMGLKYNDYSYELNREKIRFNLALSSGLKSIALSYRSADEDGNYAIASSFIDEVKFISGIEESRSISMRQRFDIFPYAPPELLKNTETEYERGLIAHKDKRSDSLGDIALSLYSFSPSALRTYSSCPFKYMMDYLFEAGEEEEEEGAYSAIEVGNLYHQVLYKYYRCVGQFESFDEDYFSEAFEEPIEGLRQIEAAEGYMDIMEEKFRNTLRNFIIADIKRMKVFEKAAGNVLRPYMLESFMENESIFGVNVRCIIDRVDMEYENIDGELSPTGRYIIYDYKKSSITSINQVLENKNYQLSIYYQLVHQDMVRTFQGNADCMGLLYLSIEKTESSVVKDGIYKTEYKKPLDLAYKRSDVNSDKFDMLMDYVKGLILDTISSIKSGNFTCSPECCNFEGCSPYSCGYENICRYSKSKGMVVLGK